MATAQKRRKPFGEVGPPRKSDRRGVTREKPGRQATPAAQDAFEATLAAERREAEAKAATAERKRDEAPVTRGPRATPPKGKGITRKALHLPRVVGTFKRQAMRSPKKVLLAEMVAVLVIITVSRVSEGEAPKPSDYLAPFVVYLVLAFAAEFGGSTARFASVFGALILVSVLVSHSAGIVKGLGVVTFGPGEGPTTLGAQGVTGFEGPAAEAGQGSGGGGGGSW
jgi:hypothetical protein